MLCYSAAHDLLCHVTHLFGKFVGVSTIGVQMSNGLGSPAITEKVKELMYAFGTTNMKTTEF